MPAPSHRLAGKTAVITGTASGHRRGGHEAGGRMTSSQVDLTYEVEQLTFADWKWNIEHEMDVVFLPLSTSGRS